MAVLETSWTAEAQTLGYQDEREMLNDLYFEHGYSINQIAKVLGHSSFVVRKRLMMLVKLPLRQRGGPNNVKRKLAAVTNDVLFKTSPKILAAAFKVHEATIFAEKRLRQKQKDTTTECLTSTL